MTESALHRSAEYAKWRPRAATGKIRTSPERAGRRRRIEGRLPRCTTSSLAMARPSSQAGGALHGGSARAMESTATASGRGYRTRRSTSTAARADRLPHAVPREGAVQAAGRCRASVVLAYDRVVTLDRVARLPLVRVVTIRADAQILEAGVDRGDDQRIGPETLGETVHRRRSRPSRCGEDSPRERGGRSSRSPGVSIGSTVDLLWIPVRHDHARPALNEERALPAAGDRSRLRRLVRLDEDTMGLERV